MVRKEDVCDWFQSLPAHKRVDYMCGLLDMCLPLELRFIGTVLEDLAKKDFHYLRDQEIKANQRADLSSNNLNNLSDQKLRAKILSALALMSSTNLPCAEIIFEILQQQFDSILGLLQDKIIAADIILLLTMAVHHPAFTFYQKDRLGQILERVDGRFRDLFGDEEEERDLVLQAKPCEMAVQPSSLNNRSQSPVPPPEKATVVAIEVISAEPSQNKKGGAEYRIRTTWSNEEVTEVLLKFKQLQDLHYKILNKFPEERKTHVSLPVFPGLKTHKEESSSDRINSLNSYFSKLTKAPAHILNCDILTEPLRSGTLVKPAPVAPAATSSPVSPFSRPDRKFESPSYHQPVMMPPNHMVSQTHPSPGAGSQMSSAANSPANSRTSSPAPGRGNNSVGIVKASNMSAPGSVILQPARSMDQCGTISQLLQLLNLEEYYDNLKDKTFQQIMQMSKEELAMAGLPAEAQAKLKSKLDQINYKPPEVNGIIDLSRFPAPEAQNSLYSPIFYYYNHQFQIPPYLHHQFAAHPAPIAFMPSQPLPTNEHSPANSGTPSPPPSPYDHKVGRHHMAPVMSVPVLSPPATVAADFVDVKSMKPGGNIQLLDSSGSEEERNTGFHQEMVALRGKGRGRPQQSRSFPLISHSQLPVSALEAAKLTGMPISMSAPHNHQGLINAEIRTDNTPPLPVAGQGIPASHVSHNIAANLVNGYMSDQPPVPHPGPANVIQRPILGSRTYKTAQPAHTNLGLHKNIMNMPTPDVTQTMTNLGKNNHLQIVHGNLPPQPYTLGASVPPAHVMGLNQVNFPSNNIQLGPQQSPTQALLPEGGGMFPPVLMYSPRDMLTSIANSTTVMTTTSSHHSAPLSHSPSPASTTMGSEQLPVAPFHAEVHEPNRSESSSLTPPGHVNSVKLQTNPGRTNSGTPSPPLIPATSKQMGHNETQHANRGHMFMPCLFPQPLPSHFHNGINSDYWRLPHHIASLPSHHNPLMYGNIFPPQPGGVHAVPNSGSQSAPTNQNHSGGGQVSTKSKCYNCGLTGHKAPECTESRMEHMSNTFHLSYKPNEPPA